MTPSDVSKTIDLCYETGRPVFLTGPPGVGKSALVADAARRMGITLVDLRLSQLDAVDMRGLPFIVKITAPDGTLQGHETRWVSPSFLPKTGRGILFLDEINTALPAVQVVAYQLTHDRRIGDYVLPDGWLVVAAGNRQSDRAVVNRMSSALASRFLMVNYEPSVNDWSAWAVRSNIEPEIISCVRAQPDLLFNFDPAKWQDGTTFACPRTWVYLDETIKKCPNVFNLGKSVDNAGERLKCWELELVQGIVGPAAGMQFFLHLQHYIKLPTAQEIIADPAGTIVPDNASARHAVSAALIRHADSKTFGSIIKYLKRLPREFAYYVVRTVTDPSMGGHKWIASCPEHYPWVKENADLFGLTV